MFVTPKRLLALPVAVAVAAAMAPTASAAMGGAAAGTTLNRPDLRSATVQSVSDTGVTTIRVCYNKAIASVPDHTLIFAGEYDQPAPLTDGERAADSAARVASDNKCLDAVWSTADIDVKTRTYVRLAFGAVANLSNNLENLPDSVALNGSDTHNGTRGHAQAPDLEGVQLVPATNSVRYIFDQRVDTLTLNPANFNVTFQDGSILSNPGIDTDVSGNVVEVDYVPGTLFPPGNPAVQASIEPAAVFDFSITATNTTRESVAVPGTGGRTNNPDLVSVDIGDGDVVDFTYDDTLVPGANFNTGNDLALGFSNGTVVVSDPAGASSIVNGNTLRVDFSGTGLDTVHEHIVWAHTQAGVVNSSTSGNPNNPSGVPAGGNAGAFATGFTTGPEALTATSNNTNGVVSIRLDQRFITHNLGDIQLVDDAGALIPGNPISVSGAGGPAGQPIAEAQFTPGQVAGAKSVLLTQGGFVTALGVPNVDQIIAFSGTAKYVKKAGKVRWKNVGRLTGKKAKKAAALKRKAFRRVR